MCSGLIVLSTRGTQHPLGCGRPSGRACKARGVQVSVFESARDGGIAGLASAVAYAFWVERHVAWQRSRHRIRLAIGQVAFRAVRWWLPGGRQRVWRDDQGCCRCRCLLAHNDCDRGCQCDGHDAYLDSTKTRTLHSNPDSNKRTEIC